MFGKLAGWRTAKRRVRDGCYCRESPVTKNYNVKVTRERDRFRSLAAGYNVQCIKICLEKTILLSVVNNSKASCLTETRINVHLYKLEQDYLYI